MRRFALALGVALAASLLAACSDDERGSDDAEPGETTSTSAVSDEPEPSAEEVWTAALERLVRADTGSFGVSASVPALLPGVTGSYRISDSRSTTYYRGGPSTGQRVIESVTLARATWVRAEEPETFGSGRCWVKGPTTAFGGVDGIGLPIGTSSVPLVLQVLADARSKTFVAPGDRIRALVPVGPVLSSVGLDLTRAVGRLATSRLRVPIEASVTDQFHRWTFYRDDLLDVARKAGVVLPDYITERGRGGTSFIAGGFTDLGEPVEIAAPPADLTVSAEVSDLEAALAAPRCADE